MLAYYKYLLSNGTVKYCTRALKPYSYLCVVFPDAAKKNSHNLIIFGKRCKSPQKNVDSEREPQNVNPKVHGHALELSVKSRVPHG